MKDILLFENVLSIVIDFTDGVICEVQFLKVLEVFEYWNTCELFDLVLVENQLTEIFVWGQFCQFGVLESEIKESVTCWLWDQLQSSRGQACFRVTQVHNRLRWGSQGFYTTRWPFGFLGWIWWFLFPKGWARPVWRRRLLSWWRLLWI